MFSYIYHTLISTPLYNGLVFLMDAFPWMDAGVAIIVLTILVKLVLFPLSKKSIITQIKMRSIEPELAKLKQKHAGNQQAIGLATMNLYKTQGVNPFAGILLVFIQLPILFALYRIFIYSGLPTINNALLYSFVKLPVVNMNFIGLVNISHNSVTLSIIAAVCQYIQIRFTLPKTAPKADGSFQNDLAQSMNTQMKYVFPVLIFFIAWKATAAVALYLTVSSLFTIGQEIWVRRSVQ